MMEKSALAGEGGGARPTPFTLVTLTYKVAVQYTSAERADTLNLQYFIYTNGAQESIPAWRVGTATLFLPARQTT